MNTWKFMYMVPMVFNNLFLFYMIKKELNQINQTLLSTGSALVTWSYSCFIQLLSLKSFPTNGVNWCLAASWACDRSHIDIKHGNKSYNPHIYSSHYVIVSIKSHFPALSWWLSMLHELNGATKAQPCITKMLWNHRPPRATQAVLSRFQPFSAKNKIHIYSLNNYLLLYSVPYPILTISAATIRDPWIFLCSSVLPKGCINCTYCTHLIMPPKINHLTFSRLISNWHCSSPLTNSSILLCSQCPACSFLIIPPFLL